MPKRQVTRSAPVLPFDYPWEAGDTLWPCGDCLPWHVEIYFAEDSDDAPWWREWHAVGCRFWDDVEGGTEASAD